MDEQNNEMQPKLNLLNLAGGMGKLVDLANKFSDPATLADLEAQGKLTLADVQELMADVNKLTVDGAALVAKVQKLLGE